MNVKETDHIGDSQTDLVHTGSLPRELLQHQGNHEPQAEANPPHFRSVTMLSANRQRAERCRRHVTAACLSLNMTIAQHDHRST